MRFRFRKPAPRHIDILPQGACGVDAIPTSGSKRRPIPINIRCHAGMVSQFTLQLNRQTLPKGFELAELLLSQLMQQQHAVDLKQCYWDWRVVDNASAKVFVVLSSDIDPVIAQLPAHCEIQAITPLTEERVNG